MRYSMTCRVDSRAVLDRDSLFDNGPYRYEFLRDSENILSRICITTAVSDPRSFQSTLEPGKPGGPVVHIRMTRDFDIRSRLLNQFKRLESLLAFSGEVVERIHWDAPKEDVICESDEERSMADVSSFEITAEYERRPLHVASITFPKIVGAMDRFDNLIVPMAFWREGLNDHHSQRYINAFFNCYFVLEGIYGSGKTRNSDVQEQFLASETLRRGIELQVQLFIADKRPEHRETLQAMLARRAKLFDVEGIIHLIVMTRGELHHFSNNPARPQGTPFTHQNYEAISLLALSLATYVIQYEITQINRKLVEKGQNGEGGVA